MGPILCPLFTSFILYFSRLTRNKRLSITSFKLFFIKSLKILVNFVTKLNTNSLKTIEQIFISIFTAKKIPEFISHLKLIFQIKHSSHCPTSIWLWLIGIIWNRNKSIYVCIWFVR